MQFALTPNKDGDPANWSAVVSVIGTKRVIPSVRESFDEKIAAALFGSHEICRHTCVIRAFIGLRNIPMAPLKGGDQVSHPMHGSTDL